MLRKRLMLSARLVALSLLASLAWPACGADEPGAASVARSFEPRIEIPPLSFSPAVTSMVACPEQGVGRHRFGSDFKQKRNSDASGHRQVVQR